MDKRRRNAKLVDRNCADFSVITPLSVCKEAEDETRGGPSTFENMPFLHAEDALLDARRASSSIQSVTL